MNVIVYTNFPDKMFEKEFLPKLQRLDLNILKTVKTDRGTSASVDGADLLIALVATMSHSQFESLQRLSKNTGVPLVPLARQSSEWAGILERYRKGKKNQDQTNNDPKTEKTEETDMNIPSVPWDMVPQMADTFMRLVDQGAGEDTLLAGLRPFWRGRPLQNIHQLDGYIRRLRVNGRCPAPLRDWLEAREKESFKNRDEAPPVTVSSPSEPPEDSGALLEQKTEEIASLHVLLEEAAKKERAQADALEKQHAEITTLRQQLHATEVRYADDLKRANESIGRLRDLAAAAEKRVEELERQLAGKVNGHVNGHDNTKKALVSLVGLMDMGLMTSEEAIAKLRTLVPS